MRISDTEVKKLLSQQPQIVDAIVQIEVERRKEEDRQLIQSVTAEVVAMPDRDAVIAELRAKIEAGQYNPTGAEIADAMIRRAIADRIH